MSSEFRIAQTILKKSAGFEDELVGELSISISGQIEIYFLNVSTTHFLDQESSLSNSLLFVDSQSLEDLKTWIHLENGNQNQFIKVR